MQGIPSEETGDNAHRFAPAAPDENRVFGACCPGWHSAASHGDAVADWISFMDGRDVDRVCCLLPSRQFDGFESNLDRYRRTFGDDNVLHAPIPDYHLADESLLEDDVLPFLDDANATGGRVVVHCLAGIGRTGQVLAVWLAHDRGYDPERAIEAVEAMGRLPRDAVQSGNASEEELQTLISTVA